MVKDAVAYLRGLSEKRRKDQSWLLLGKGPSATRVKALEPDSHLVVSLNHACLLAPAPLALAHFIDLSAFADCAQQLFVNRVPACLPWHPNVAMRVGKKTVTDHAREQPFLAQMLEEGLVYSYNGTTADGLAPNHSLARVRVRFFSAVAAFNLLVASGVRHVRGLGVDGGTAYAPCFDGKDRLANGRPSFDVQFAEIERTCKKWGATFTRL
jgi:hypothetical protein